MPGNFPIPNLGRQYSNSLSDDRPQSPSDLCPISPFSTRAYSEPHLSSQSGRSQLIHTPEAIPNYRHSYTKSSHSLSSSTNFSSHLEETDDLIESMEDVDSFEVPSVFLKHGMLLLKISHKSKKRIQLKVDPANFKIMFNQVSKSKLYEFFVDDIKSFCARENANHYREEYGISKEFEKRWLTVVYYNHSKCKLKTLNLITDTSHDLRKLFFIIENFKRLKDEISKNFFMNLKDLDENSRNAVFGKAESADKSVKEMLTFADVLKFCKRLNINLNPDHLEKLFLNVLTEEKEGINFDQFKSFVKMLKERPELTKIWKTIVNGKDFMSYEDFETFMVQIQKEPNDIDYLKRIFKKFSIDGLNGWTEEIWNNFMHSKYSFHLKADFQSPDYYRHSLNEYYILSSHNTYLIGRQVAGDSSIEGYIKALRRGCKCIEIDIWDNPDDPDGDPLVNHGRTFTNGICLSNALRTIKKYAFAASPFPVILSLEIHCSAHFQVKVISSLKETFGEMLVEKTIDFGASLPSPDALRNRILVKVKKTSPMENLGIDENGKFVSSSTTGTSFSESNDSVSTQRKNSLKLRRRKANKVIDALSELGVYMQGVKFRNFSLPESKMFNHCFSLSEKAVNSMLKDELKVSAVDKHNRKYLMRIYPSKYRLKSSNFVPINYWAHGCQMVATNWQTYDLGQQLNEALFEKSQGLGYILKPLALRRPLMKSTMRKVFVKQQMKQKFCVEIVSAQQLPKPFNSSATNPFVIVELIGTSSVQWEKASTVGATRLVAENGFNPVWNQRFWGTFECDSNLVFLRLTVHSSLSSRAIEDSKEIGILVVNLFDVNQGYRYFPLNDSCGEQLLYSTLFLKIEYSPV